MLPKFVEDVIIVELTISVASIEEASSIYVIKTIKIITNHQLRVGFVMLIICLLILHSLGKTKPNSCDKEHF